MARTDSAVLPGSDRVQPWVLQTSIIVGASLFVALCARITLPLPFTPVPLTLQNFGVLVVGLLLGSRSGFAALASNNPTTNTPKFCRVNGTRSEEHTSELQSHSDIVCRLLL